MHLKSNKWDSRLKENRRPCVRLPFIHVLSHLLLYSPKFCYVTKCIIQLLISLFVICYLYFVYNSDTFKKLMGIRVNSQSSLRPPYLSTRFLCTGSCKKLKCTSGVCHGTTMAITSPNVICVSDTQVLRF